LPQLCVLLQKPFLFQAHIISFPGYYMVQQFDTHDFPGFLESAGQVNVLPAGGGVAAGVVVERDDGLGVVHHGGHKDVSGFDIEFIDGTGADNMNADDFVSGI
jgi:hypothetical protein